MPVKAMFLRLIGCCRGAGDKHPCGPEHSFAQHIAFLKLLNNGVVFMVRMFLLGHGFVDFRVKLFPDRVKGLYFKFLKGGHAAALRSF